MSKVFVLVDNTPADWVGYENASEPVLGVFATWEGAMTEAKSRQGDDAKWERTNWLTVVWHQDCEDDDTSALIIAEEELGA